MVKTKDKITCQILTQEKVLFSAEIDLLFVPSKKGVIAILPYHTPMISVLTKGEVFVVISGKKTKIIDIDRGLLRVDGNNLVVLVDL